MRYLPKKFKIDLINISVEMDKIVLFSKQRTVCSNLKVRTGATHARPLQAKVFSGTNLSTAEF